MKRIKLTDRDIEIIEFLKLNKCADTETLSRIFFNSSLRACQNRLKKLVDNGNIKAFRENILTQNIYYVRRKPISYKHALKVTQFIAELHKLNIEIIKYRVPYKVGNVIADALFIVKVNNQVIPLVLEVELTKFFDLEKYQRLYYSRDWKEVFPMFPKVIVVSDKKVKTDRKLDIIKIDTSFSNVEEFVFALKIP